VSNNRIYEDVAMCNGVSMNTGLRKKSNTRVIVETMNIEVINHLLRKIFNSKNRNLRN